ncbi:hypothetical protein KY290_013049 [Solanum tuberosum]|uniref:Integrase catalytic domain-containing protein n=1 Tax=Solanum tuberosum TaxID=4113 RepID=A0ABQ7VKQ8_SOLTU|nr:hypothetical protein KY290_013049 [Solanum tuberosum]
MVENQSGFRIQSMRSENGKEYNSEEFNKFCEEPGITHQLNAPYTPQQNGVSERRNRYIMEILGMLHEKELLKFFWAKAANTAVFLQNRLPTKALLNKTLFEAWNGFKPSLSFIKVFGCVCFFLVPQVKRDKLDKKALPGIFVGYSSSSKTYKVYNPQTGKMIVSRDAHFTEEEKWNWKDNQLSVKASEEQAFDHWKNELVDDLPIRGTRLLSDIYQQSNMAVCEPAGYDETLQDKKYGETPWSMRC